MTGGRFRPFILAGEVIVLWTGIPRGSFARLVFPAQTARYIRISQTGTDPTSNWSIYELDVYR